MTNHQDAIERIEMSEPELLLTLHRPRPRGKRGPAEREAEERVISLRALAVLTPSELHVIQGYSPVYGQYWQYKSSETAPLRSTRQRISRSALLSFRPVRVALESLCEHRPGFYIPGRMLVERLEHKMDKAFNKKGDVGGGRKGGGSSTSVLHCSRETAARKLRAWREHPLTPLLRPKPRSPPHLRRAGRCTLRRAKRLGRRPACQA